MVMLLHDTIILGIDRREVIILRTVLLVLLSDSFRYAMHDALKERYRVIVAPDAILGAELLNKHPDILILDLFLSGTNGFSFLKQNRSLLPPTVLLFTIYTDQQILDTAESLSVHAIFMKPCSISAVLKQLEQT